MSLPSWHPYKDLPPFYVKGIKSWTPAQITTALWLDAADSSTITIVDDKVSAWDDKSGNGIAAANTTASKRPSVSTINGVQAIQFSGSTFLNAGDVLDLLSNNVSAFAVVQLTDANAGNCIFAKSIAAGALGRYGLFISGPGDLAALHTSETTAYQVTSAHPGTFPILLQYTLDRLSGNLSLLTNAAVVNSITFPSDASTSLNTSYRFLVGAYGNADDTGEIYYARALVGEIVLLFGSPDASIRQRVEGYLTHKWRLTASLPSDHPYKLAEPTISPLCTPAEITTVVASVSRLQYCLTLRELIGSLFFPMQLICSKVRTLSSNIIASDYMLPSHSGLTISKVNNSAANVSIAAAGSNGGLFTIASNGAWTFDPNGDFSTLTGDDTTTTSVTYHISDGVAEDEGTLTVTVSGVAAAWTPAMLSSAVIFDPDDSDSLTLSGSEIAAITDSTGVYSLTQGTSSKRPALVDDTLNGHAVASFDGGDDLFGSISAYGTNPVAMFVVWKTTTADTCVAAMLGSASSSAGLGVGRNPGTGGYNTFVWGGTETYLAGTNNQFIMQLGQMNGSGQRTGLNGSLSSYASASVNLTNAGLTVGQDARRLGYGYVIGQLAVLVICDPSDTEVDKLFGWAAHKYGLTSLLPADHPYKTAVPTI